MTRAIYVRAAARRDLIDHYVYLAANSTAETAERFWANAERSFAEVAEQPEMGSPLKLKAQQLAGMRKWRVKGFGSFLIFYIPRPNGVSIVRVLHGAQEWWRVLEYYYR